MKILATLVSVCADYRIPHYQVNKWPLKSNNIFILTANYCVYVCVRASLVLFSQ